MTQEIKEKLIRVLDAYEGSGPLVANQGQALDGFSALAAFVDLIKQLKQETR